MPDDLNAEQTPPKSRAAQRCDTGNRDAMSPDESRIAAALDGAGDAIAITDPDFRLVYCNAAFRCLFRRLRPDWDLKSSELQTGADIAAMLGSDPPRQGPGGADRWTHDAVIPAAAGTVRHIHARISTIPEDGNAQPGLLLIVSDVTPQRRAEALLQRRLTAMETASDGIMITNRAGTVTYANPAQCRMLGLERGTIENRRWDVCLRPAETSASIHAILAATSAGEVWRGEIPAVRPSGGPLVAETTLTGLADGGHVWIQRDTTERHLEYRERARIQRQSQQARKLQAIGRLAGGIAHDFNNLLASIMGYAGFLKDDLQPASQQHGYVRQIVAAGERGRDLVDRLLSVSTRRSGERRPVDLGHAVHEALSLSGSSMSDRIVLRGPIHRKPVFIDGNETELIQAVMNLCLNARDALSADGGRVAVSLGERDTAVRPRQPEIDDGRPRGKGHCIGFGEPVAANRYAVVTVADTGTGIAPENLEEIAEPFYTTKPAGEGTGLGLATVNGIVAAHGGTVTIRSTLGRGTAVELVFPAIDLPGTDYEARSGPAGQHEAELGAPQPATPPTRDLSTGSGTILVIDDDGAIADLLADLLDRLGVDAIGCNDPTTAIDTIREAPNAWRAIVVDMIMPRMTGLELIADLRQHGIDVPAVLISGQPPEVDRDTLAALNITAFAQKPIRTPDLRRLFGGRDPA